MSCAAGKHRRFVIRLIRDVDHDLSGLRHATAGAGNGDRAKSRLGGGSYLDFHGCCSGARRRDGAGFKGHGYAGWLTGA